MAVEHKAEVAGYHYPTTAERREISRTLGFTRTTLAFDMIRDGVDTGLARAEDLLENKCTNHTTRIWTNFTGNEIILVSRGMRVLCHNRMLGTLRDVTEVIRAWATPLVAWVQSCPCSAGSLRCVPVSVRMR